MNNSDERKIEYFIALCDDLITCKFLVAESKIQRLLIALADTQPIYELVSDCMQIFNRDREMGKAFVTDGKGHFWCNLPTDEAKFVALVFCTLADIDEKKIDFTDFIKRFFDDEEGVNCYTSFARRMILPFRELIAEAFGYPKRYNKVEETENQTEEKQASFFEEENKPLKEQVEDDEEEEDDDDEINEDKFIKKIENLSRDMLLEINSDKHDYSDTKIMLEQIIKATEKRDLDLILALALGIRYAGKAAKHIKFLLKEFNELVDEFYF